jgi:hypothetical protein
VKQKWPKPLLQAGIPHLRQSFHPEVDDETGEISHLLEVSLPRTTPEFVLRLFYPSANYIPEGTALQYDPQFGWAGRIPTVGWFILDRIHTTLTQNFQNISNHFGGFRKQNIIPAMISLEFLHAPFYRLEQ